MESSNRDARNDDEGAESREVLVTGGTGLVGRQLLPALETKYDGVRILSRTSRPMAGRRRHFGWDGIEPSVESLQDATAVVHLAGEPIFGGLPTASRRRRIRDSRVESTRALVAQLASLPIARRPRVLVCASAVGVYGDRGEEVLDESSKPGRGFLADVCREWESEANRATQSDIRVVCLRIGVVLTQTGGAFAMMRLPFSLGLGGRLGSGRQFFPWIHLEDLVGVILWALESGASGPVNAVAPEMVRNVDLTRWLGAALRRPTPFPVPGFALRLMLRDLADELLGSRCVRPRRLEDAGFEFRHPILSEAIEAEFG